MKKIFLTLFSDCALMACGDSESETATTTDTTSMATEPVPEPATAARVPVEGDVTWDAGTVRVYRNNTWEDANDDVRFDNDVVVYRDGRVVRGDVEYEWEDGYVIDRDGNVWTRTGNALDNAWEATKYGVKETGKAVKHVGKKIGEKTKDAVD